MLTTCITNSMQYIHSMYLYKKIISIYHIYFLITFFFHLKCVSAILIQWKIVLSFSEKKNTKKEVEFSQTLICIYNVLYLYNALTLITVLLTSNWWPSGISMSLPYNSPFSGSRTLTQLKFIARRKICRNSILFYIMASQLKYLKKTL